jgi:hypothetical protein
VSGTDPIAERPGFKAMLDRIAANGVQLTSGVAHDFNNLLTVALGNIGFLEKDLAISTWTCLLYSYHY